MHLLTHILLFSQRKKWFAIHSSSLSVPVFPLLSQCHTLLISLYVTRAQNQLRREASWSWLPAARGTAQQLCWPETETFCKEGVDAGDVSDRFILSNSNKEGAFFFFLPFCFLMCFYLLLQFYCFPEWFYIPTELILEVFMLSLSQNIGYCR